jgi:hypothetical protein
MHRSSPCVPPWPRVARISRRVLGIPTPRWVLYDRLRLGADIPEEAVLTGQERAYTSSIWYTPAG